MKCNNIIVTGGMGFIGSNFIRFLEASEFSGNLLNVDALKMGSNTKNLEGLKLKGYSFLNRDLSEKKVDVENFDCIFNFASETHVDRSIADPELFLKNNIWLVFNILEAIRLSKSNIRLIHASTDEIYGDALSGSFDESSPVRPSNPYSATKVAQEALILSYVRTYGIDAVITRSSNNFGPYQFPEKFIPKTIIRAMLGLKVPLYGNGKQVRSWIFAEDNVRAMLLVSEKGVKGEIYNIPGVQEIMNKDLATKILKIMGKDESFLEFVEDRPGHDIRYSINGEKLKALGFMHEVSLEEGIKRTVNWYVSNRSWWEPLIKEKPSVLSKEPWKL